MGDARVNTHGAGGRGRERAAESGRFAWLNPRKVNWLRLLLLALPVAVGLRFAGAPAIWLFAASALAIIPLAGLMGEATEQLAHRLGPGIGGLLNATFGNAAELIIALFALFKGYDNVVKASLTGSIIGNVLLVLGASMFAGGLKYRTQHFNRTATGAGAVMLVLAAFGMLIPAIFHELPEVTRADLNLEHELSIGVCVLLIVTYLAHLIFSLVTHKDLFNPEDAEPDFSEGPAWTTGKAIAVLLVATLAVAWMSEILVGAVEQASETMGMNHVFVGVVLVAIVGNAAEHSTAVLVALKNEMDLAVGIAVGSGLQIALFVAPVLVFASYLRAEPMDLRFTSLEILAVILAVLIARMVAEDGESNWLEGLMLLMVYGILGLAFFFLPERGGRLGQETPGGPAPAESKAEPASGHAAAWPPRPVAAGGPAALTLTCRPWPSSWRPA